MSKLNTESYLDKRIHTKLTSVGIFTMEMENTNKRLLKSNHKRKVLFNSIRRGGLKRN